MRALVTGVNGFVGSHLADLLRSQAEVELWGAGLFAERPAHLDPSVRTLAVDLRKAESVHDLIQTVRPDVIYHLAGQAYVPDSRQTPWDTLETNTRSCINLMEAALSAGLRPRTLLVSSYEVYDKQAARSGAVDENWPLGPDSPYGVSKVAQDFLARYYSGQHGIPVIVARPFNHVGPRQSDRFVAAAFGRQVALISLGQAPPVVRVGNLAARRDFTDVRDIVRAYVLLMGHAQPGEVYNLGSGRSRSIRELLETLLAIAGVEAEIRVDPERYRSDTDSDLVCDSSRARACCGWRPEIPLENTLADLLAYERERLRPGVGSPVV